MGNVSEAGQPVEASQAGQRSSTLRDQIAGEAGLFGGCQLAFAVAVHRRGARRV
jgi:hypothetical protein